MDLVNSHCKPEADNLVTPDWVTKKIFVSEHPFEVEGTIIKN